MTMYRFCSLVMLVACSLVLALCLYSFGTYLNLVGSDPYAIKFYWPELLFALGIIIYLIIEAADVDRIVKDYSKLRPFLIFTLLLAGFAVLLYIMSNLWSGLYTAKPSGIIDMPRKFLAMSLVCHLHFVLNLVIVLLGCYIFFALRGASFFSMGHFLTSLMMIISILLFCGHLKVAILLSVTIAIVAVIALILFKNIVKSFLR